MKKFFENLCAKVKALDGKRAKSISLLVCIVCMGIGVLMGAWVQTAGGRVKVKDLRNASNSSKITIKATDKDTPASYTVSGKVASGVIFIPKKASAEKPVPGVVFTHGLYNNREMQEQNAIELARRGYVTIEIDCGNHGHNETNGQFDGSSLLDAAKYLYNLPYVDKTKIAVSGHSMGGSETNQALARDGVSTSVTVDSVAYAGQTDAALKKGFHMGIISAGIVQANNTSTASYGTNLLGVAIIKASSDEFFFSATLKAAKYVPVTRYSVTESNYTNYYVKATKKTASYDAADDKPNDGYVKVTDVKDAETGALLLKFKQSEQYYNYTTSGNSSMYLESRQAVLFTQQANTNNEAAAMEKWETVNGGIYAGGQLLAKPEGRKLVSAARKGVALAERNADGSVKTSIRAIYEAKETHPMNHFSTKSCGHIIDFLYNVFGTSPVRKYIAPTNQTWLIKECFAAFGFLGIFGMLIVLLDMFLETKSFKSLKAEEDDIPEAPVLLTSPRKHVSYWLGGILTAWFGQYTLRNMIAGENLYTRFFNTGKATVFAVEKGFFYSNINTIAAWGILCALFALAVTAVIWAINKCINAIVFKDDSHDEHPFHAFRIRSWENAFKTVVLAAILVAIFYGTINVIWWTTAIDFRFWTFDLRVFNLNRIVSMLKYAPYFFIFYMVNAALNVNYRVKDLPEWATILINIAFNVGGVLILLWYSNAHFINSTAQLYGLSNNLWFIAAIPVIPCIAVATVISRRFYKRTGNAWLAGIVMAVIMTFIACANTSIDGSAVIQMAY